jgi:hypothetical protein
MHELPLDGRLRQILRHYRCLQDTVLLWIFQRLDDGLGGQSVLERISNRARPYSLPVGSRLALSAKNVIIAIVSLTGNSIIENREIRFSKQPFILRLSEKCGNPAWLVLRGMKIKSRAAG